VSAALALDTVMAHLEASGKMCPIVEYGKKGVKNHGNV